MLVGVWMFVSMEYILLKIRSVFYLPSLNVTDFVLKYCDKCNNQLTVFRLRGLKLLYMHAALARRSLLRF